MIVESAYSVLGISACFAGRVVKGGEDSGEKGRDVR